MSKDKKTYFGSKKGFTIIELILASSISLTTIIIGFYVLKSVIEGNKIDEIQFGLNAELNDAIDFIIDEVDSGERIIDNEDEITLFNNSCSYPENTIFVFGIRLPDQALIKSDYKNDGDQFNLNQVDCPIIYSLKENEENKNNTYSLLRYGPQFNVEGYYISPLINDFQTSIILNNVSKEIDNKKIICKNSWKTAKQIQGINYCIDSSEKSIEIQIEVQSKNINFANNPRKSIISSGGFSKVQDESQISLIPDQSFNEDAPNCIGGSCCLMGVCLKTRKITFMLDISESMNEDYDHRNGDIIDGKWVQSEIEFIKPKINGKSLLEYAKSSLKDHLNRLPISEAEEIFFQIIAYNNETTSYPESTPIRLTKTSKLNAFKFLESLEANNLSNPWDAICSTLEDETIEQIILISSGVPSIVSGKCADKQADNYDDFANIIREYNRDERSLKNQGSLIIDTISYFHNFCESNKNYLNNNWMGMLSEGNESECIHIK